MGGGGSRDKNRKNQGNVIETIKPLQPPPSPTQAMNNDSSPVYDDTSDYEAFITKRNCCKLKQIVKFEDQY